MKKTHLYLLVAIVLVAAIFGYFYFSGKTTTSEGSSPQEVVLGAAPAPKAPAPTFLFISDVHLRTSLAIANKKSDSGMDLWYALLSQAETILNAPNSPSFIVYTGDLPEHNLLGPGHNDDLDSVLTGFRRLAERTGKPFFYMPGNNDAIQGDYQPFSDKTYPPPFSLLPFSNDSFPALNTNGTPGTTPPCYISTPNPTMDYYSVQLEKGFRLIALNTVMYSIGTENPSVNWPNQSADCDAQLTWLANELANAKKVGDKVMLAMHVPPGIDDYNTVQSGGIPQAMWIKPDAPAPSYQDRFLALTEMYQTTISGILYGHTHMEELRLLYGPKSKSIVEVAISCPGITPLYSHNPAFKVVSYDAQSKELLDFKTYYTELGKGFSWKTYTFSSTFSAKPTTPIYNTLTGMKPALVNANMNKIFATMLTPTAPYETSYGIPVQAGQ